MPSTTDEKGIYRVENEILFSKLWDACKYGANAVEKGI